MPSLNDPWQLGPITFPNRVGLAPLAAIGNWAVRLQAKRYGAGFRVSEMVSSFGIHYGNEKTCVELLRTHPDEGDVVLQLFGQDPDVMRSAAKIVAERCPQVVAIDLNMGCPVPKVCKTGAGAALLKDPDTAVAVAAAAREGSGLPVTVKLRSGNKRGEQSGYDLAHRLVDEAGVAAITFHPRSAQVHHKGTPDYDLARALAASLKAPLVLSGGLHTKDDVEAAFAHVNPAAVVLARGALGNPWLFAQVLGKRQDGPSVEEVLDEHDWIMARVVEHLGAERGGRYLRKFHPWYVDRLGGDKALQSALQQTDRVEDARRVLRQHLEAPLAA